MKYFETSLMPQAKFLGENINFALERYKFAARFAEDKIVLDAGCGTGYGASELSKKAKKIFGIDQNLSVIQYAQKKYQNQNIIFLTANLENIEFPDNYFDLICGFEVIEHIQNYQKVLNEFYRILKPNGLLLISTPNKAVYSPYTKKPFYPFHFHEFYLDEFKKILEHFQIQEILGQKGKKILYPKWHPKSILKIVYTSLPQFLKENILRNYLKFKKNRNNKKIIPKLESSGLNQARIFIAVCKKI